jgi:hypothetical protein
MITTGAVLSITTTFEVLLAAAELPALSEAVPAGILNDIEPFPVTPTTDMVRDAPLPDIITFPRLTA